jgi:hypothetical protein
MKLHIVPRIEPHFFPFVSFPLQFGFHRQRRVCASGKKLEQWQDTPPTAGQTHLILQNKPFVTILTNSKDAMPSLWLSMRAWHLLRLQVLLNSMSRGNDQKPRPSDHDQWRFSG